MVFEHLEWDGHEEILHLHESEVGLRAIIALHRVRGGAALGGIRFRPYESGEAALTDVLRLSRAMTHKWALTGLGWGGGKSVILGDPARDKSAELLRAFGTAVDRLGGRYLCAPDVGTNADDMAVIREATRYVAGLPGADTSVATAIGLFHGLRAMAERVLGRPSLDGVTIAVQGAGGVGAKLCGHLADAGARVQVADVDRERLRRVCEETGATPVDSDGVLEAEVDLVSPCALGAVLNAASIGRLRARGVCGAANNQLASAADADRLRERGIAWAPDYVVSAGGIISGARELGRIDENEMAARLEGIYDTTLAVLELADAEGITTDAAALRLAHERAEL